MRKFTIYTILLVLPAIILSTSYSDQKKQNQLKTDPPFITYSSFWVDSVFKSLTLEQKIGQLIMIDVSPTKVNMQELEELIKNYHIGGIIYFKGTPHQIIQITNYVQSIAKVPIMTAIDGEWGPAMRLSNVIPFPKHITLGAISDNMLVYEMATEIANQLKILGININFAPIVDLNNNPENPVIGIRSFGEDKYNVTQKAYYYAQALQDNNILPVLKHFPGHGNTTIDSHKDLPILYQTEEELKNYELFPFEQLINEGIGGVMIGHLYVPTLEPQKNLPATLSSNIINNLLIKQLGYKGLVFTDALTMKGYTKNAVIGKSEVDAILAGNDILLMPQNPKAAFDSLYKAVLSGKIPLSLINQKVYKILSAKYWMKLNEFKPLDTTLIIEKLNSEKAYYINEKIFENAITLLKNKSNLIPIKNLTEKFCVVSITAKNNTSVFFEYLNKYTQVDTFSLSFSSSRNTFDSVYEITKKYDYTIIGIFSTNEFTSKNYGLTAQALDFINQVSKNTNSILVVFTSPYILEKINSLQNFAAIALAYENSNFAQKYAAQAIFGGIGTKGKLPVTIKNKFKVNEGIQTNRIRLKYAHPLDIGANTEYLKRIDSLIVEAINNQVFPGAQIIAVKDGVVFYQKEFGYHTYDKTTPVKWNDLYDIASITKVAATTLVTMKLYEQNKINLYAPLQVYLPMVKNTNKQKIEIIDLLTHRAQLKPYVYFFSKVYNNDFTLNPLYASKTKTDVCNIQIADSFFISKSFQEYYINQNINSELLRRKKYKYSDIGFILWYLALQNILNNDFENFLYKNFYENLGCNYTMYKPIDKGFPKQKIIPSEIDISYRKQVIHGFVNDVGASVMGNISGHAGLFSNANDLAKIFQMLLQKGTYGDYNFLTPQTVETFLTTPFNDNHRAIGFDTGKSNSCSDLASKNSFGHTGFTGCLAWADPDYNLIFIFLSNRTFPNSKNNLINKLSIRQRIQTLVYQSIIKPAK